jgi:hypothetical protein
MQKSSMFIEHGPGGAYDNGDIRKNLDDDGRPKRTGKYAKNMLSFTVLSLSLSLVFLFRLNFLSLLLRNMGNR